MTDKKFKPFNLEAAKAGAPVITRDGEPVRLICFDAKNPNYPVVALCVSDDIEVPEAFTVHGCYHASCDTSTCDLFMAPVKKNAYLNIYPRPFSSHLYLHPTREIADQQSAPGRITCVHVEWEE